MCSLSLTDLGVMIKFGTDGAIFWRPAPLPCAPYLIVLVVHLRRGLRVVRAERVFSKHALTEIGLRGRPRTGQRLPTDYRSLLDRGVSALVFVCVFHFL